MNIPGLGEVTTDNYGAHVSTPIPIPIFGGKKCCILLEEYDDDDDKEAFHVAITNFLTLTESALKAGEEYVFQYYKDSEEDWKSCDDDFKPINSPGEVWAHVRFGSQPVISRRGYGDKGIYVSVECGCDWEEEHGMQLVFKNGLRITKVGPYDGHLTNSDAYADDSLENVVYKA